MIAHVLSGWLASSYRGRHWGVPLYRRKYRQIKYVIPQKKMANIAIPHRESMKYRNRKIVTGILSTLSPPADKNCVVHLPFYFTH